MADSAGQPSRRDGGFGYQPALDGLRAVAVVAVLLFHGEVSWMPGGYVGVSVFFTLSGFLITSLLIREHASTGRIRAGAFYARRARRLLPAGTVCLLAVAALAAHGTFDGVEHLRRDLAGAALQVFNWVKLAGGSSYADLFQRTGGKVAPLDHYWSLAIEEQFYWLWPVSFAGLAALAKRRSGSLTAALAAPTVAFIVIAPVIAWVWGPDAAYWSTPARVGEILTGAVAAAVVAERGVPAWSRAAAPAALVAIVAACVTFPSGSGPAYRGLLPLLSVVTAVLLLGLQDPGPLRSALSWRPVVLVGVVSYGLYLYHWPIYAVLDEGRLGWRGPSLLALRLGVTAAVAAVSYVVIERPVRRARWQPAPTLIPAVGVSLALVAVAVILPSTTGPEVALGNADRHAAIDVHGRIGDLRPASGGAVVEPTSVRSRMSAPVPSRPVRILVVGDSVAKATGNGLAAWAASHPKLAQVTVGAAPGCGLVLDGKRVFPEQEVDVPPACHHYTTVEVPDEVRRLRPDVVVVMSTWDTQDRRWDDGPVLAPTDPDYRRRLRRDLASMVAAIRDAGASRVSLVLEPESDPYWNKVHSPQEEPARHQVLHDAMRAEHRRDPTHVRIADVRRWLSVVRLTKDHDFRPDGVHWSPSAATRLATDYLGPLLVTQALS